VARRHPDPGLGVQGHERRGAQDESPGRADAAHRARAGRPAAGHGRGPRALPRRVARPDEPRRGRGGGAPRRARVRHSPPRDPNPVRRELERHEIAPSSSCPSCASRRRRASRSAWPRSRP
jgi:hypothetical protein